MGRQLTISATSPPHAPAGSLAESSLRLLAAVDVSDSKKFVAEFRSHAQLLQLLNRRGHQPFAAGLVDDPVLGLEEADAEAP